ncbi:MAG TPA: TRAP transporter large permease subunit [Bordetella sp.]
MKAANPLPASTSRSAGSHGLRIVRRIDRGLVTIVNIIASILVVVETALLFAGIVARYVFQMPLIWSDELAEYLFLWLAMLGAVLAYRADEHMKMTAVVDRLPQVWRDRLDAFVRLACLVFLCALALPALSLADKQAMIHSPALGLPLSWRYRAVVAGVVLMGLFEILRLFSEPVAARRVAGSAIVLALLGVGVWYARDAFTGLGQWNLLIFFVGVVVIALVLGTPIGFAFGLASIGYVTFATHVPSLVWVMRMSAGMTDLILLAVPLFIFLGLLLELSGMAKAIIDFLASLLGHVRGGLSYVLIGAIYLVSGISGAKAADMAAVVPILFPEMRKLGTPPGELVALLSATGAQTETVPPSLVLITIGSVTGVSVAALFAGGLLPSLLLGLMLCVYVGYKARRQTTGVSPRAGFAHVRRIFVRALPAIALPFVIRYAVVEGIATATEVSTIGIAYCLIVGAILYRHLEWRKLGPSLAKTATLSGAVLFIMGTATAMGWAITQSGFSQQLAQMMSAIPGGSATFLAASILLFVLLGSVLEGIPAVVLFAPLLFPIAKELGVNEIHYAMVIILSMGLGLFSPPMGIGYYTACAISRIDPNAGLKAIWGYMAVLAVGVLIVACVPWLSTAMIVK